jgi:predicted nicotinamide N-methyase
VTQDPWEDVVEETIAVGDREVRLVHPRDGLDLLDEEAFERDEYLPYWAEPWPSGQVLTGEVARADVRGRRVLELGCGLALPSIAAALGGAQVLATDWSADAIAFAEQNALRNGVAIEFLRCSWAEPEALVARAPWDLVLAADVIYERRNVDQLLRLLPRLVDTTGEVWIADPNRPTSPAFLEGAESDWHRTSVVHWVKPPISLHRLWLR